MKIRWEVDDGYAGKSRPHFVEVDDDELAECETEEERNELINDYVKNEFENKINWFWEKA
jgi:hypothetical protein